MRALALAVLLVLVAMAPPPVAAPMPADHLQVFSGTLRPLGNRTQTMGFDGGPLFGGWVFLLEAKVGNGSLAAELALGGRAMENWTIPPGSWHNTTVLPADGFYNLTLSNPGTVDVTYSVYFDQSCNCAMKEFPSAMPDGLMIFDTETAGPGTVSAEFNKPDALSLRISAALLAGSGGRWPEDFTTLGMVESPVQRQAGPGIPPVWLYPLNVSVSQKARVYYFVQAVGFNPANLSHPAAMVVGPVIDFAPTPPSSVLPLVLGVLAAAFAVAGGVILWRGRRKPEPEETASRRKGGKGKGGKKGVSPRDAGRGGSRTRGSRERRRRS